VQLAYGWSKLTDDQKERLLITRARSPHEDTGRHLGALPRPGTGIPQTDRKISPARDSAQQRDDRPHALLRARTRWVEGPDLAGECSVASRSPNEDIVDIAGKIQVDAYGPAILHGSVRACEAWSAADDMHNRIWLKAGPQEGPPSTNLSPECSRRPRCYRQSG
jgi:hypothetical protein